MVRSLVRFAGLTVCLALSCSVAIAETVILPIGSVDFPSSWVVEKNGKGSVIASPHGPRQSSYFAFVQSCSASDRRDCDPTCDAQAIRRNFIRYKEGASSVVEEAGLLRVDIEDAGILEPGVTSYAFRRILCKPGQLIAISALSKNSAAQSKQVVHSITNTIKWRQ